MVGGRGLRSYAGLTPEQDRSISLAIRPFRFGSGPRGRRFESSLPDHFSSQNPQFRPKERSVPPSSPFPHISADLASPFSLDIFRVHGTDGHCGFGWRRHGAYAGHMLPGPAPAWPVRVAVIWCRVGAVGFCGGEPNGWAAEPSPPDRWSVSAEVSRRERSIARELDRTTTGDRRQSPVHDSEQFTPRPVRSEASIVKMRERPPAAERQTSRPGRSRPAARRSRFRGQAGRR